MLDSWPATVGSLVESIRYGFRGTVVYVGTAEFSQGPWVGLTLDDASGMTNRTVRGKHFLTCNGKPGMFVRHSWIKPVRERADTTAQRLRQLPRLQIVDMFKFQTMWITVGQLWIKLANEEEDTSPATAKLPKREIVETPSTPAQTPLATPVIPTLHSLAAKKVAKEAMVAKEQYMVEMVKAMLERERAEERASSLQEEADSLRVKVDTLTMNLDILTCEIEEKRCHIKQLEEENGRLEFKRSPPKVPYKAIALASVLFFIGSLLIVIGALLLAGYFGVTHTDRTVPDLIIGILVFLPGFYHLRIAYYASKGYRGYSYDDIPDFDD